MSIDGVQNRARSENTLRSSAAEFAERVCWESLLREFAGRIHGEFAREVHNEFARVCNGFDEVHGERINNCNERQSYLIAQVTGQDSG